MTIVRPFAVLALVAFATACSSESDSGSEGPVGSESPCPRDGTSYNGDWQALECQVLTLVNEKRAQGASCGGKAQPPSGPLTMHGVLRKVAREHAQDMGAHNYFDHDSLDGKSPFERMEAAGYEYRAAGENIAGGSDTAQKVMEQWMNSEGHCRNIMNAAFTEIGIGYALQPGSKYKHYWVQDFGTPR